MIYLSIYLMAKLQVPSQKIWTKLASHLWRAEHKASARLQHAVDGPECALIILEVRHGIRTQGNIEGPLVKAVLLDVADDKSNILQPLLAGLAGRLPISLALSMSLGVPDISDQSIPTCVSMVWSANLYRA